MLLFGKKGKTRSKNKKSLGNNRKKNKQFKWALRQAEVRLGRKITPSEIRRIHDRISGADFTPEEIVIEVLAELGN